MGGRAAAPILMLDLSLLDAFRVCGPRLGVPEVDKIREAAAARLLDELRVLARRLQGFNPDIRDEAAQVVVVRLFKAGPRGTRHGDPESDASLRGYLLTALPMPRATFYPGGHSTRSRRASKRRPPIRWAAPTRRSRRRTRSRVPESSGVGGGTAARLDKVVRTTAAQQGDRAGKRFLGDRSSELTAIAEGRQPFDRLVAGEMAATGADPTTVKNRFYKRYSRALERIVATIAQLALDGAVSPSEQQALLAAMDRLRLRQDGARWRGRTGAPGHPGRAPGGRRRAPPRGRPQSGGRGAGVYTGSGRETAGGPSGMTRFLTEDQLAALGLDPSRLGASVTLAWPEEGAAHGRALGDAVIGVTAILSVNYAGIHFGAASVPIAEPLGISIDQAEEGVIGSSRWSGPAETPGHVRMLPPAAGGAAAASRPAWARDPRDPATVLLDLRPAASAGGTIVLPSGEGLLIVVGPHGLEVTRVHSELAQPPARGDPRAGRRLAGTAPRALAPRRDPGAARSARGCVAGCGGRRALRAPRAGLGSRRAQRAGPGGPRPPATLGARSRGGRGPDDGAPPAGRGGAAPSRDRRPGRDRGVRRPAVAWWPTPRVCSSAVIPSRCPARASR